MLNDKSKDNVIVFKGKKNSILVLLDASIPFEELKEMLSIKAKDASKFFGGATTAINFSGRDLSKEEEEELVLVLEANANLNISEVLHDDENNIKLLKKSEVVSALYAPEHMTSFHHGSLRNGQSIRYNGSVIVIGDINPGAEIIAEGNILVLGTVKGLVHSGCMGNTDSFIFAINLLPLQLRIADIATYIPDSVLRKNAKKPVPSYAYVQDGQIYIVPLI